MSAAAKGRLAPTLLAGALGLLYVLVAPPSRDLAAHLLRARLFAAGGFGVWSNWWYGGHHLPGYGVLFDPLAAALTPQLAAALAATATAAAFAELVGREAWPAALLFAAGTATDLFTGRLSFALGLLPAVLGVLALRRGRTRPAALLGAATALASPVAALFCALAGAAAGVAGGAAAGLGLAAAALLPVLGLAVAFPEGGSEPFGLSTLWPVLAAAGAVAAWTGAGRPAVRAGALLYAAGCLAAYLLATPVGSNAARLGALLGAPLIALAGPRGHPRVWLAALAALVVLQWQAPVADLAAASGSPTTQAAYWRPLLGFLGRAGGPPFRVEVVLTDLHWEALYVAPRFPLARGWERQLDVGENPLFYAGTLSASAYHAWLRRLAVRFVALPDAPLDPSARGEARLIGAGLPYLRLALRARHWRVYAVRDATPLASGPARVTAIGPDSLTLRARAPGRVLVRVRFTPYWRLTASSGCVAPAGDFTALRLRRAGTVRLVIGFSLGRIGARSPRCG